DDFGLKTEFDLSHPFYCPKPYKALCKNLGVGLFGGELVLRSPKEKPVGSFLITWSFKTGDREGTAENSYSWEDWSHAAVGMFGPRYIESKPLLTAETKVRKVNLSVGYSGSWSGHMDSEYITDLRCLLREKLKKEFPEVTIKLTD